MRSSSKLHAVGGECVVPCEQAEVVLEGVGDQHPIERIAEMAWKLRGCLEQRRRDVEHAEFGPEHRAQVAGGAQLP